MSKRNLLPVANFNAKEKGGVSPLAFDRWNPAIKASDENDNTIGIYDPIGYDYWDDSGVTAKRISAALRSLDGADVVVNINSPGGDVFEGLAIYNLLREYKGHVTVRVLGVAASAASFIAMAADEIQIARAGFFMIHNAWTGLWGNRNDLRETADFLEQIDDTIADIYHVKSGLSMDELKADMDKERWINGRDAIDSGFADAFLPSDVVVEDTKNFTKEKVAAHKADILLAKAGMSRSSRRELIQDLKGTPGATNQATPSASNDVLESVLQSMRNATEKFST
ncbi:head maturation protease, ClpP-related [Acinetobacter lwoffii]|jgi:ATP-dependent Clp endopeptidase proteolytic subunit ClpP|uniref:head maturation protease, ClpP-related n=1 Tax=Acinetobacter TaxID=469 RepID=UPI0002D0F2FA|nr:head maturation protease, ClpP-related [Acinetobacter lwoffii]ENW29328.1 ATP-dependent Clp endopeptidase, proteolytic subunit ClpP [Acinetobacter lwoffii ATCC 9957 = CIP 70.31]MCU4419869.1 Clp protease ClpP [Acinetobacter lwoffii]